NCFGLDHFAKDCVKKKKCKYCGRFNHSSDYCFHKKNKKRQRCILCKDNHASDLIICPVIQKTRQQIGIKLSRREQQIIQKKDQLKQTETKKILINLERKNKTILYSIDYSAFNEINNCKYSMDTLIVFMKLNFHYLIDIETTKQLIVFKEHEANVKSVKYRSNELVNAILSEPDDNILLQT
ncbi:hypothetical protein RFI_23483, partial [Reticulomyxa filosa]